MPAKDGFTLVEMIFCLAISITLSAISLPLLIRPLGINLNKQANQVLACIDYAKSNSLLNHETTYLSFEYDNLTISDHENLQVEYRLSNSHFDKRLQLYFNKSGNINQANSINLIKGTTSKKIVVNLGTGHCYVK